MTTTIDELDREILRELRRDARTPIKSIAERLGRRRATIHNRIQKLEENGIIRNYTIAPDFHKLGKSITAFLLVSVLPETIQIEESLETLSGKLADLEHVVEVYNITGEYDYLLKVRVDNLEEIGSDLVFKLRKEYGIGRTLTLTVFHTEIEELTNWNL